MHLRAEAYLPGVEASGKTVRVSEPASGVRVLTLDRPGRQIMTTFTRDHKEQVTAFLEKRPARYANE